MTSGDSGIVFKFFPTVVSPTNPDLQIPFPISPNATVTMLVQFNSIPALPHEEYVMARSADSLSASYMLTGTEFPEAGIFRITMRLTEIGSRLTADESVLLKVDADFIS